MRKSHYVHNINNIVLALHLKVLQLRLDHAALHRSQSLLDLGSDRLGHRPARARTAGVPAWGEARGRAAVSAVRRACFFK